MGAMERLHPLAAAGYFAGVAAVAMVSMNPVLLGLSLLGSAALLLPLWRASGGQAAPAAGALRGGLNSTGVS